MPDYFSHYIAAEKISERLDSVCKQKISDRDLYLLGAQGGDIFFAYQFKFSSQNAGRQIHRMPAEELFTQMLGANFSYLAGFAAHYALDCTLHPAVYAYEATRRSPFAHQNFERDLGLYISKFYRVRRAILPRERVLGCTFEIYDSIKSVLPQITVTGVERCLKRHFEYTRYLFRTKKQTYKCDYDFTSLAGTVEDALDFGAMCIKCLSRGNVNPEIFAKSFLEK